MGFLKNLKLGIDMARNPPSAEQIQESLKHLTPEQRAAYDANMAQVAEAELQAQQNWEQAAAANQAARILQGPAATHLYGAGMQELGSPVELNKLIAEVGVWEAQKQMRAKRKGELKSAVRQTFNRPEIPEEEDPAQRDRIAAEQRGARDAARVPYRAPDAAPIAISRLATRGDTQLKELVAHLGSSGLAARPEEVFGVYRVPDRVSQALTPHSEKGRIVEWDIVHLPSAATGAYSTEPDLTSFAAEDQWVARRLGEPSIVDEELGMAFLRTARIGPERCLGLARYCEFRSIRNDGDDDASPVYAIVKGLVAIHPDVGDEPYQALQAQAPLPLPVAGAEDVAIDVLNWGEIARAVRPKIHHPPPIPSPFPYLPSTPQELLRAYIEVVGLQPQDCYSVQATIDRTRALQQGGLFTTNLGAKQPCADGKSRMRSHGCEHVVFVYRDSAAYAAGRERWAAYQGEVLQADLRKGLGLRDPLVDPHNLDGVPRGLHTIVKIADKWDRFVEMDWAGERLNPHRYCWPPVA